MTIKRTSPYSNFTAPADGNGATTTPTVDRQIAQEDTYFSKAKKLIPAEVAAAFLAINSIVPMTGSATWWIVACIVVLAATSLAHLRYVEHVTDALQLLFTSVIVFPIWALNIAIVRFPDILAHSHIPASLLIIMTAASPALIKDRSDSDSATREGDGAGSGTDLNQNSSVGTGAGHD